MARQALTSDGASLVDFSVLVEEKTEFFKAQESWICRQMRAGTIRPMPECACPSTRAAP